MLVTNNNVSCSGVSHSLSYFLLFLLINFHLNLEEIFVMIIEYMSNKLTKLFIDNCAEYFLCFMAKLRHKSFQTFEPFLDNSSDDSVLTDFVQNLFLNLWILLMTYRW